MSPAACAGSPPGPRSESPGTAGLLYAVLAAGTAFAGVRPGRVLGPAGACLEAVFPAALPKQAGWGVCGAVVRALIRDPRRQAHRRARSAQPAGRAVTLPAQPGTSS
jgi:hypothetical protein